MTLQRNWGDCKKETCSFKLYTAYDMMLDDGQIYEIFFKGERTRLALSEFIAKITGLYSLV